MEKKKLSLKHFKRRKFLMVLPLLVLPCITVIFWAFGGGKGGNASVQNNKSGLNLELPEATLKDDKPLSKLNFYEQAERDSARHKEQMKNDPYYQEEEAPTQEITATQIYDPLPPQSSTRVHKYKDPNEERVYRKLAQLNEQLNKNASQENVQRDVSKGYTPPAKSKTIKSEDIDRLQSMMGMVKDGSNSENPEMKQINGILEKVLDVQHPDRVKERYTAKSAKQPNIRPVTSIKDENSVSLLQTSSKTNKDRMQDESKADFYGLNESIDSMHQNSITAVVANNQVLVTGAVVKLRLSQYINIQGQLIPKGQLVFGIAELNNERLSITINSIRYLNSLFPVRLEAYDLDGMSGIYIPGAITRDVAKQTADNAIQSVQFMTMDRSLPSQAAAAGVNAAKSLLSKKVKQVKVTVKAGYIVMLKDKQEKQ